MSAAIYSALDRNCEFNYAAVSDCIFIETRVEREILHKFSMRQHAHTHARIHFIGRIVCCAAALIFMAWIWGIAHKYICTYMLQNKLQSDWLHALQFSNLIIYITERAHTAVLGFYRPSELICCGEDCIYLFERMAHFWSTHNLPALNHWKAHCI